MFCAAPEPSNKSQDKTKNWSVLFRNGSTALRFPAFRNSRLQRQHEYFQGKVGKFSQESSWMATKDAIRVKVVEYHPRRCWKFLNNGRCHRTNCGYYHVQQNDIIYHRRRRPNYEYDHRRSSTSGNRTQSKNNRDQKQAPRHHQSQLTNNTHFL